MYLYHSANTVIEPCISSKQFRVKEIMCYIDKNIENPMCLDEIASNFYISPTCAAFSNPLPVSRSINILLSNGLSMQPNYSPPDTSAAETCARCGFNEYSNFYKSFTSFIGVSPSQYLKKNACETLLLFLTHAFSLYCLINNAVR